jgi:hypothetical protein
VFKAVAVFGPIARIGAAIVTANTVALDVHVSHARLLIEEELRARVAFELWSTMPSREAVVFPCAPAGNFLPHVQHSYMVSGNTVV